MAYHLNLNNVRMDAFINTSNFHTHLQKDDMNDQDVFLAIQREKKNLIYLITQLLGKDKRLSESSYVDEVYISKLWFEKELKTRFRALVKPDGNKAKVTYEYNGNIIYKDIMLPNLPFSASKVDLIVVPLYGVGYTVKFSRYAYGEYKVPWMYATELDCVFDLKVV